MFDRSPERSWEEKIFRRDAPSGTATAPVTVWGHVIPPCGAISGRPALLDRNTAADYALAAGAAGTQPP